MMGSPKVANLESDQRVEFVQAKGTPLGSLKKRISAMLSVIDSNVIESGGKSENNIKSAGKFSNELEF